MRKSCFNPHPSRRTGATRTAPPGRSPPPRFNPHPSRRTGATQHSLRVCAAARVSILTRPEGRVQRFGSGSGCPTWMSFNPHPSRRTGATPSRSPLAVAATSFNPHPSRRTGATGYEPFEEVASWFQSSPVPKDGCNSRRNTISPLFPIVSILTRPEGRVQRSCASLRGSSVSVVSILTRPEGRVQLVPGTQSPCRRPFQSSPVPKDGCNTIVPHR